MVTQLRAWRHRTWSRAALRLAVGALLAVLATLPIAAADPPVPTQESRAAAAYERELKSTLQAQQKLVQAFQTLLGQDAALRNRIITTATTAQNQMQEADRMATLRLTQTPAPKRGDRDDRRGPTTQLVDQSGAKAALAMNAMQLAALLPSLNAALWRNNAALKKIVEDGEANQREFRRLADPFGRRSLAESERAIEIMNDALLADPGNGGARLVLGLAYIRLGRFTLADSHLAILAEKSGPWQDLAIAAAGHMRSVGWLGQDTATRRAGAAEVNRAVALKTRQAEPLLFRALENWHDEKWSQIEPDMKAALRLSPDHLDGLRLLAWFYAVSPNVGKKLDDAEATARRACELTAEQDAACLETLAAVLARRGAWDAAIDTQTKAVAVACGDVAARAEQRLTGYQQMKPPDKASPVTYTKTPAPPLAPAERAVAEVLESLRMPPDQAAAPAMNWQDRGRYLALCRKWGPAAANYAQVRQDRSMDVRFIYGCLLWLSGEKAGFQELCQRVSASGDTSDPAIRLASVTADSGLLPVNVLQAAMQARAPVPVDRQLELAFRAHCLALAKYRAGQYDDVRKQLRADIEGAVNLLDGSPWKREGLGLHWQLLALTEAREGFVGPAREAARKASLLIQDDPPKARELVAALPLDMWLEYQVLNVELQALLDAKP